MNLILSLLVAVHGLLNPVTTPAEPVTIEACDVAYYRSLFTGQHHVSPFGPEAMQILGQAEYDCAVGEITPEQLASSYLEFLPRRDPQYIVSQAMGYYREL